MVSHSLTGLQKTFSWSFIINIAKKESFLMDRNLPMYVSINYVQIRIWFVPFADKITAFITLTFSLNTFLSEIDEIKDTLPETHRQ